MMNPTKFGIWVLVLVLIGLIGTWLNPGYMYEVDWFFFLWFALGMPLVFLFAYSWTEGHIGGYPLVTPYSHSATATGDWAMVIPGTTGYEAMVAFPKGGGNAFGIPFPGGGKNGWTVVPKSQVLRVGRSSFCNTFTREVRPDEMPSHIHDRLKRDKRWREDCMVEYGEQPWIRDLQGEFFDHQEAADYATIVDQQNTEMNRLVNKIDSLMQQIESDAYAIREIATAMRSIPSETIQERAKRVLGGEDANRE